jgi:hypothetical protein
MNLYYKKIVLPLVFLFLAHIALAQQISSGEFFIDTDPGVGNGTSLFVPTPVDSFSLNFGVSTNSLSSGFHNLFVRFKYNNGIWGLYEQRPFYIYTASVTNTAQIVRAEYFFDTDPGVGNATGVNISPTDSANINLNIPINSLSAGFHNLFVRFKYNNGKWGLYEQRSFYIFTAPTVNTAQIVRAEYFFDTDPGVGNATGVNISPTDSANVNINADATGLSTGSHILYVRFKYNNGKWGLHEGRAFTVCSTVTPASITPQGTSTICPGSSIVLTANTGNGLTYQWQRDGVNINGATNSTYTASVAGVYNVIVTSNNCPSISNSVTIIVSAPSATITPQSSSTICTGNSVVLTANSGNGLTYQWRLNGTNINGATSVNYTATQAGSYTVVVTQGTCNATSTAVTVTVNPGTAITTQPQSQSLCAGGNLNLSVSATGSSLTYQWYKNNTLIAGATASSYSITGITTNDAGNYTVIVTGACGNVTSSTAVVSVGATLSITNQPQSQTICEGLPLTLSVLANGTGISYQWRFNGTNISGATNSSYTISNPTGTNSGSYTVVLTNSCGTITSQTAVVTVNPGTAITTQPQSQSLCAGGNLNLSVSATGSSLTYQWYKNNTLIAGATASSYSITGITTNDAGNYTVIVTGACGNVTSSTAVVSVGATLSITNQPQSQTICEGLPLTLSVSANGTGISYQWRFNGTNISGATNSSYTISNPTGTNSGSYTVVLTNSCGTITSQTAVVTVNPGTAITTQPQSQSTCTGGNVTFSVVGVGSGLTYQWFKAGSPINGATNPTYTINGAAALDAGNYTVVVSGSCGLVTSQVAVLSVSGSLTISQQPQSQTVCQGQPVTLGVIANGINTQYQWQLNGVNINGATNNTYIIGNANPSNSGSYTVNITSGCGNATSQTAILTVNPNVGTTLNQSICNGNSYSFNGDLLTVQGVYYDTLQAANTCDSIVTLNLTVSSPNAVIQQNGNILSTSAFNSYQWLFNGSPIVGAQGQSYTATQNGTYAVIVTDANTCSDTSDAVVITVGINENYLGSLMIFPNPTSNLLYLKGDNIINDKLYIDLRDITGRLISKRYVTKLGPINESIYLEGLTPGIYILVIGNNKNEQKTFKISKID